jgi:hypothetical protein
MLTWSFGSNPKYIKERYDKNSKNGHPRMEQKNNPSSSDW